MWFFESRKWNKVMTTEWELTVTVNRVDKVTWERFFPENPTIEEYNIQEFVALGTYWNTYLSATSSGALNAIATFKTANSKL